LLCCSKAISDGVNSFEADQVLSFVFPERFWLDAEDFFEFIVTTLLD